MADLVGVLFEPGGFAAFAQDAADRFSNLSTDLEDLCGAETRSAYIWVPDADVAYARAVAAGARVVTELHDTHYGSRDFTVMDPEGYSWSVGTYDPWAQHE